MNKQPHKKVDILRLEMRVPVQQNLSPEKIAGKNYLFPLPTQWLIISKNRGLVIMAKRMDIVAQLRQLQHRKKQIKNLLKQALRCRSTSLIQYLAGNAFADWNVYQYLVANMLDCGKTAVYDLEEKMFLKNIACEKYEIMTGELEGRGGRIYVAGGKPLWDVIDWMA